MDIFLKPDRADLFPVKFSSGFLETPSGSCAPSTSTAVMTNIHITHILQQR